MITNNNEVDVDRLLIYLHFKGEININEYLDSTIDLHGMRLKHYIGYGMYTLEDNPYGLLKNGTYYVIPFDKVSAIYHWMNSKLYFKQFNIKLLYTNGRTFLRIKTPISTFDWD